MLKEKSVQNKQTKNIQESHRIVSMGKKKGKYILKIVTFNECPSLYLKLQCT